MLLPLTIMPHSRESTSKYEHTHSVRGGQLDSWERHKIWNKYNDNHVQQLWTFRCLVHKQGPAALHTGLTWFDCVYVWKIVPTFAGNNLRQPHRRVHTNFGLKFFDAAENRPFMQHLAWSLSALVKERERNCSSHLASHVELMTKLGTCLESWRGKEERTSCSLRVNICQFSRVDFVHVPKTRCVFG